MTKWVTKKLGEICWPSPDKYNPLIQKEFKDCIEMENIEQNSGSINGMSDISKLLSIKNKFEKGDVLYGKLRPYLRKYWLAQFNGVCSTEIWVLKHDDSVNSKYLFYLFQTEQINKIANLSSGTKMPRADWSLMQNKYISIPESIAEQRRIAGILSSADGAIAASEALIAKYRNIKRGLLTTLLQPKEGWKKVKLGECLTIGNGQDYKHLHKGDIPVYGTGGVMTYVDDYLFDGETVCIGRKGTINKPIFHCGKIWTVDTLFYTHSFVNVLPLFIYYAFCCIDWLRYNEATGVPSLSKETIYKIEINIPEDLAEQRRIAEILSSVDAKIAAEEKVVEKYKGVKKGLMEELLKSEK